jgi:hypothetical protein
MMNSTKSRLQAEELLIDEGKGASRVVGIMRMKQLTL